MSKKAIFLSEESWRKLLQDYSRGDFRKFVRDEGVVQIAQRSGFVLSERRVGYILESHPVGQAAITATGEEAVMHSLAIQIAAVSWLDGGELADAKPVEGGRRISGFGARVIRFLQELGRVGT